VKQSLGWIMGDRGMDRISIKPRLKPYSEIIETAARMIKDEETMPGEDSRELTEIDILDVGIEMDARLRELKLSKTAVVLYVNFASHNVLTYSELAEEIGLTEAAIKTHLQTVKRKFPHLFLGATPATQQV